MKTYSCDKCGLTKEVRTGIVGGEFDYSKSFGTLASSYRKDGIVDLCLSCLSGAEKALSAARDEQAQAVSVDSSQSSSEFPMNNPADTLAALADKADAAYRAFKGAFDTPAAWRKDGSDYADDARQRLRDFFAEFAALASLKGEAVVPALEVFRIAGGDVECCPNPTAAEAMDCLRDLRQCYEESLTAPPPQQADLSVPPYLDPAWGGASDMGQGDDDAPATQPQQAPTPSPAPQGGGEAEPCGCRAYCSDHGREFIEVTPDGEEYCHECSADGFSGELCSPMAGACAIRNEAANLLDRSFMCAAHAAEHVAFCAESNAATPPAQQPGEVGEAAIFAAARKYSTTGQDARMRQTFEFDDHGLREFVAALAPKEKGNG